MKNVTSTCDENLVRLFPHWLFWLLDHFDVICAPHLGGVPLLMVMSIYAIQLVCFCCGCCRCLRKYCPAKCLKCVFSTCRHPCGIVSRIFIEALVFSFIRLFSKEELGIADADVTYLLFLKKPVAFTDRSNPLLKPAYNTRSDGCCCFSLVTVFSALLFLIVGMVTHVFAKHFPVTVSDNCTLYDENNNLLYCFNRRGSLFNFPLNCTAVNTAKLKVDCYAFTFELGKASGDALGQLTFSVFMIYTVILLIRLWIKLWHKILGTNGRLASCLNHICTAMFGFICFIILCALTSILVYHDLIKLLYELGKLLRQHFDLSPDSYSCPLKVPDEVKESGGLMKFSKYLTMFSPLHHDVRYLEALISFTIISILTLPFSITCLVSYYEHKPVFNLEDVIGNHPQGDRNDVNIGEPQEVDRDDNGDPQEVDRDDNGDAQEVDRDDNGDPQEVDRDDNGDAQEVDRDDNGDPQEVDRDDNGDAQELDRNNDGDPQEVNHDDNGDAQEVDRGDNVNGDSQEVDHGDNGDLQEVDRGDNGNSQEVDHDDIALQEIDHDDGKPQENAHDDPDGEITPDHLLATEPSDSPQLRQRRPRAEVSNQPDPGIDCS